MTDEEIENLPPSKSARKREMTALQKLGESLMELTPDRLAQLPLSKGLLEAFKLAKSLKHREAKRRQLQYIGKLMRAENHGEITAIMTQIDDDNRLFRQHFQRLEKIRDQLIGDDQQALEDLLNDHPELDRQHLRQLIRQIRKQQATDLEATNHESALQKASQKLTVLRRKLFEYLRENLSLH